MAQSAITGTALCSLIIALSAIAIQMRDVSPLNEYVSKNSSSTKPYKTFEEFYPHYLDEHTQQTTRLWHYVGSSLSLIYLLINPVLSIAMATGCLAAYAIIPYTRHLSTGMAEAIVFALVYFINGKLLTNSFKKALIPLVLGYGCSWIGHFGFEHNKPAAFIYPTYSFFGDMHMMYDAIKDFF